MSGEISIGNYEAISLTLFYPNIPLMTSGFIAVKPRTVTVTSIVISATAPIRSNFILIPSFLPNFFVIHEVCNKILILSPPRSSYLLYCWPITLVLVKSDF